ncbi:MAG: amino acid adenylation domain-containing protein, partial [Ruminococcus sp.]|nr:amino acid adenylation domain-containing protein [Ruminococcus sp.]
DLSGQAEYWKSQFDDEIPVLDMPTDFPRPQEQSYTGTMTGKMLDDELSKEIKELVKKSGATEYMVFLAAAMVTLSKYSRQEDIVIGSPISGRTHRDTEEMLGMFVNTLAMRGRPEGNKTFNEFLQEIKETCIKAYENQEYPFEELVEAVGVQRDMSRNPLFDVMLTMQNNEITSINFNNVSVGGVETSENAKTVAKFDLSFDIIEIDGQFLISLEFCTKLYKHSTARLILQHLSEVLKRITDNSNIKLKNVDMLTAEEYRKILVEFNDTQMDYPKNKTIIELFEEQVRNTPDNIALVFNDEKLTYKELNERANILAHKIRELGVEPDDFVGLVTERSAEMIIGIFGILKAGGAYVPIDHTNPADRISYILKDCNAKLAVVYDAEVNTDISIVNLDDDSLRIGNTVNPDKVNSSENIAYCIYTSGTTGKPKGVMICHRSVVNLVQCYHKMFEFTSEDRVLQFANYCFDQSIGDIFCSLCAGAALYVVSSDDRYDMEKLENYMADNKITSASLTPKVIHELNPKHLDSLRLLDSGGEAGNLQKLKEWIRNGKVVLNTYGPTESTVNTTYEIIGEDMRLLRIGYPTYNTRIYIMTDGQLCGIGVPGELCIAGDGLAKGYLGRPELTEEKFIPNPFGEGKLYKSGDLARWMINGNVEYLARIDEQVKIRGYRIELGEIETRLSEIEDINDCVVIAKNNASGDNALYAYYTSDIELNVLEIRDKLSINLPDYMVPAYMMQIDEIPITKNGKLNKNMLPEITSMIEHEYEAPETAEEKAVSQAFCEVLGIERAGKKDTFFDLGGDSIKAIRIISSLRNAGYKVSVREIMSEKSVENIAAVLINESTAVKYEQGEVNGLVPKTPIINEFEKWHLAKPEHYNQAMIYDMSSVSNDDIRNSVEALVKHHDMLRAVYRESVLEILPSNESRLFDCYEFDYSNVEDKVSAVEKKCTEIQSSIDLAEGPLVKVGIFDLGAVKKVMICIHHLVIDMVSWSIISDDLKDALEQISNNKNISLSPKTASFIEWAKALDEFKNTEKFDNDNIYWKKIRAQIDDSEIIYENYTDKFSGYSNIEIALTAEETEFILKKSNEAFNTETKDILLSALAEAVYRYNEQDSVNVFFENHGRVDIGIEIDLDRTIGWFTNIYPVVIEACDDWDETIITNKDKIHSVPNNGISFGLIYGDNESLPDGIEFNYMGEFGGAEVENDEQNDNYSSGYAISPENKNSCSISINGSVHNGILEFMITYDKEKYSEEGMKRFAECYHDALVEVGIYCSEIEESTLTASDFSDIIDSDDFESIIDNL